MKQADNREFFVAWKGVNSGPFTLVEIQEKLATGEVSRMHQVQADGRWVSVDEFLAKHDASARQVRMAQEAQLRRDYEAQLAAERSQQQKLADQLESAERRARFLPPDVPPPVEILAPLKPLPHFPNQAGAFPEPERTSGFAITAFICSLCNLVPFLNFISWIPALVFGHVALRDIGHNPALAGRGLAIAALCITYFLLVLGLTFFVLMALNGHL